MKVQILVVCRFHFQLYISIYFTDENSAKKLLNIYRRHHGANDVVIDKDLNARATLGCQSQCTHGFGHHIGTYIILGGENS